MNMIEDQTALHSELPVGCGRYKQIKVSVDPVIASAFKDSCAAANVSMAAILSQFMADFSKTATSRKPLPDFSTRRRRRMAIQAIVKQLEQIKDCEEQYQSRIPENLQGSMVYERADEFISTLDDAIDLMSQV